eukprot:gene9471-biopygen6202
MLFWWSSTKFLPREYPPSPLCPTNPTRGQGYGGPRGGGGAEAQPVPPRRDGARRLRSAPLPPAPRQGVP